MSQDNTDQTPEKKEQWIPLMKASKIIGVHHSVLSRKVKQGVIASRKQKRDARVTEVDLIELRQMYNKFEE